MRRWQFVSSGEEAPSPLLDGLVHHWELTADVNNSVAAAPALTNNGGVDFTGGAANVAVSGSKYLHLAAALIGAGNPISVSVWYQQAAANNDETVIQIGNNGGTPTNFLKIESNYTYIGGSNGVADHNTTSHAATTSQVHEMIVVNNLSIKRYRNGALTESAITANMADASRKILIGAFANPNNTASFTGKIKKVSIWNVDMSAYAADVYNGGTPLTYPFN